MPSLTHTEARTRADLLAVTAYRIELDLTQARESARFASTTTVEFDCVVPGAATFVELRPALLEEVTLNGHRLDPATLTGNRLPLSDLAGTNVLMVRATMAYSNTGQGLHRFTDPQDGEVYLYGQAALDDAQRMFACFDQPDLKAPISLTVLAPADWGVWGNGAATQDGPQRWELATTPPLPSYLFTVVAGPYYSRTSEHDGIPLGLLCRRTLASYLDESAEEIMAVTRACFDRFHELFGIRYPFGKYDQAFVPEFNLGAMENPGCVTFRDEMVFRSAVTEADHERRAVIIAHELAHMWFGDLVTMRWWDDLWLNESFAEYMGWRVTAEATSFGDAWTSFSVWRKGQGYMADQRPSTHPIAPDDVADVEQAMLNVDGISYAKGASALRQLAAWIGDDAFFAGLRSHLKAHAYGNATLTDLLSALSQASDLDVAGWAEVWLLRPQVNTLRPEVTVDTDGRYAGVTVVQTAPAQYPTLRPHRIGIGVYDGRQPAALVRRTDVSLDPTVDNGRTSVPELVGSTPGRLLLLNDGDLTFAKVRFDERSRAELPRVLPDLDDSLARALVWSAAADSTRDGELTPAEFVALAESGLQAETVAAVFEDVLAFAGTVARRYLAGDDRPAALATLFDACARTLARAQAGSSRQLAAAKGLLACVGPDEAPRLLDWLAGDGVPAGLRIDAELRWTVLLRLSALGLATPAQLTEESTRDTSARGAENAALCLAAIPDAHGKAQAWDIIVNDDDRSGRLVTATAAGFWHYEQEALTQPYVARYFAEMPGMAARREPSVVFQVAGAAYPVFAASPDTLSAAWDMLARTDVHPLLRRIVADRTDDLDRAVKARSTRTATQSTVD